MGLRQRASSEGGILSRYNVFRKNEGDIIGAVDIQGALVEEMVPGFTLLLSQIRRGIASEKSLVVVKEQFTDRNTLDATAEGVTLAQLFKSQKVGLVSGTIYRISICPACARQ